MRIALFLSILFLSSAVFAQTYRSGGRGQASFGAQQTQTEEGKDGQNSSAPGANSAVKTRTFTSYGSQRPWSKGVQTQGVKTRTAGTAAPDSAQTAETPIPAGADKKIGAAAKKTASSPKAGAAQPSAPAGQAAAAQQPAAMPAEAAAAMQQMQGLQEMLKGLGGAAGGAGAGAAGAGAAMPNIPGMPDMSALMGGAAAAGAQPGKK